MIPRCRENLKREYGTDSINKKTHGDKVYVGKNCCNETRIHTAESAGIDRSYTAESAGLNKGHAVESAGINRSHIAESAANNVSNTQGRNWQEINDVSEHAGPWEPMTRSHKGWRMSKHECALDKLDKDYNPRCMVERATHYTVR